MESKIYNEHTEVGIGPYKVGLGDFSFPDQIDAAVVINLDCRPEKREYTIRTLEGLFPYRFYTAQLHSNPKRGNLESHVAVVRWARDRGLRNVLILEDDIVINRPLADVPKFPEDWNMLYLGGLCTHITAWGHPWIRGRFYCGHSYLIRDTLFDEIIENGLQTENMAIDEYFVKNLQTQDHVRAYLTYESFVIQDIGWSDLDKKEKWQDFKWPKVGEQFRIP